MTSTEYTPEQQKKLEAMLAEGEALEKKHNIHPAVRIVVHELLEDDGKHWKKVMPPETEALIWKLLEDYKKQLTIGKAVFDLARLATMLDHDLKVGRIAYELIRICNDAVVKFDLLAQMDMARLEAQEDFEDITGSKPSARPAMIGEKAPEGSVRIDKLSGPKRRI